MAQENINLRINPFEYPEVKCNKCGCNIFTTGITYRAIPGLVVGQTGTVYADFMVTYCTKCHELSPMSKEMFNKVLGEQPEPKKENNSNIII